MSSIFDGIEEEADIYVPGIGQKSNTDNGNDDADDDGDQEDSTNRARTQSAGEQSKNDASSGGEVESYDDLAARFAMLQK